MLNDQFCVSCNSQYCYICEDEMCVITIKHFEDWHFNMFIKSQVPGKIISHLKQFLLKYVLDHFYVWTEILNGLKTQENLADFRVWKGPAHIADEFLLLLGAWEMLTPVLKIFKGLFFLLEHVVKRWILFSFKRPKRVEESCRSFVHETIELCNTITTG